MLTYLPLDISQTTISKEYLNERFCILIQISLKFVPKGPIDKKVSVGSGNGLAPTRRQAITWTNTEPFHWRIYAALGGYALIKSLIVPNILWSYAAQISTPYGVLLATSFLAVQVFLIKLIHYAYLYFPGRCSVMSNHPWNQQVREGWL